MFIISDSSLVGRKSVAGYWGTRAGHYFGDDYYPIVA